MKNHFVYFILFGFIIFFHSCFETKVFVQQIEVEGPMVQPMTKITSNKNVDDIETSFRVLMNSKKNVDINTNGHTLVNSEGVYEVEEVPGETYFRENDGVNLYQYGGNNTSWKMPEFQFGVNMDVPLSHYFAFTAGLDYSNINSSSYWNGNLGIGLFKELKNTAWRVDAILNMTNLKSNVDYVVTRQLAGSDDRDVYFYTKNVEDTYFDYKFMLSFNTKNIEFPTDFFFNVSFGAQKFFDKNVLTVYDEGQLDLTNSPVNFGFGVYKNISPQTRIILGTTINNQTQRHPALAYPVYFLQFDTKLFSGE